jgi:hypothetical protein
MRKAALKEGLLIAVKRQPPTYELLYKSPNSNTKETKGEYKTNAGASKRELGAILTL